MKIKTIFIFFLCLFVGFSQVHVIKDNTTYVIYTYYYTVSFNQYLEDGLNVDNYYKIVFFSNIEKMLDKKIHIKEGTYSKLEIPIKTKYGEYLLEFKENYFILRGKKTNKFTNEEIKILFDKPKRIISTKDYVVISDLNVQNSLNLGLVFSNNVNKTTLYIEKKYYSLRFKPLEEFNILIHPFYSGSEIYGDLLLNEKYFKLPDTKIKTNDIVSYIQNNLNDIRGEYIFKNKNIYSLLYLKKVCINSQIKCRIFICKNSMGIEYYQNKKWNTIYLEGKNKKDILYVEPLSYYVEMKKYDVNKFLKEIEYLKMLGKKDLRPFFIGLVVIVFLIGYSVMYAFDKYVVKYKIPITKVEYDGKYKVRVCLTENESEVIREIMDYIEKNNGYFTLKEASFELNLSEDILKTMLDYMIEKGYIEKVDNDG